MLSTIEAKVERAKEQIKYLETGIHAFFSRNVYRIVRNDDPKTEQWVWIVRISERIPLRFAVIVGEIVYDLRSALDQLICSFIDPAKLHRGSGFPIMTTLQEFETNGMTKIQGVPASVVRAIKEIKPYQGGNDALWRFHKLSIGEKHRLPVLVGAAYKSFTVSVNFPARDGRPAARSPELALKPSDRQFPLQDGAELLRIPKSASEVDMNPKFTFDIAFSEGEVFQGEPLIPTLHQLTDLVDGIIRSFDGLK
jgi:hypothetical protein